MHVVLPDEAQFTRHADFHFAIMISPVRVIVIRLLTPRLARLQRPRRTN